MIVRKVATKSALATPFWYVRQLIKGELFGEIQASFLANWLFFFIVQSTIRSGKVCEVSMVTLLARFSRTTHDCVVVGK